MTTPPVNSADLPEAIIVDVDGTLVDVSSIRHYLTADRPYRDFDAFHKASLFCPPHTHVLEVVETARALGRAVFVVTARRDRYERVTRDWLAKHDVTFDQLLMRADDDRRPDAEIKQDILTDLRRTHRIVLAIDDNPSVIALWRGKDIPVLVVPGWDDPCRF